MKTKLSFLIILFFYLSSCDPKIDNPLMNFQIGENEDSWKKKIEQNYNSGILTEQYENEDIYRYYFVKGGDSIFADVHFNSDNYDYGKLRTIKFDLRGDTAYYFRENKYVRSFGPRKIKTVDELLDWFIEFYGSPTDSVPEASTEIESLLNIEKSTTENKFRSIYDIYDEFGTLIWEKENFKITFCRQKDFKFPNDTTPIEHYRTAYILYRIKSYEEELKKITDPIRQNFTPKDVAHVSIEYPEWKKLNKKNYWDYDYEFKIDISQVQRIGREEPRNITDVQFDIVLTDAFENEICKLRDIKCELDKPIELHKGFLIPSVDFVYTMQYNSLSNYTDVINLEKARELNKTNKLKCHAEVTAVVFEDGEVLK